MARAKKTTNGANLGFEEKLWQAADKMRGHMDAAEYKHVALGLIFLKYISEAFEAQHSKLEAEPYADAEDPEEYIAANVTKPMSAYIAGVTAPAGKKMGHAGAIVSGGKGTAAAKMEALTDAGVKVGNNPTEAGELMVEIVRGLGL